MLYIHIPYCKGKCIYCDFYSGGNPDWQKYLKALVNELSERIGEIDGSLSSIYIGGGTPSLIPPEYFHRMVEALKKELASNGITLSSDLEFTVEVNPEDIDSAHIEAWLKSGVNRVSMGVQSFVDEELTLLHRRHDAAKAHDAAKLLRANFENISLDLIYGLPCQTEERLRQTLERMIELRPQHISAYALTIEEGTPLSVFEIQGRIERLSDSEYVRYGRIIEAELEAAGYERYEISNYSLPRFHSRHNSGYWDGKPYLGLGPSAASYDGGKRRRSNKADLRGYIERFTSDGKQGKENFYQEEVLEDEELREEMVMIRLRTAKGLDLREYGERFGSVELERLLRQAGRWEKSGDIVVGEGWMRFSRRGWEISDYIILDLV